MSIRWRRRSGRTAIWKGGRLRGRYCCCRSVLLFVWWRGSAPLTGRSPVTTRAGAFAPLISMHTLRRGEPRLYRKFFCHLSFFAALCRIFLARVVLQVGGQVLLTAVVSDCGSYCH